MDLKMDEHVRVGIAGLGRAGWHLHADTIAPLRQQFRVAAACDLDPARLSEAQQRFSCRTYLRYADMLHDDDVELVVVGVPSHLHADFALAALEAGKHVLVEKPLAGSASQVDSLISAARRARRVLTVNQNSRNTADFLKVRQVIDSGQLGQVLLIRIAWHDFARRWDWQTLKEFSGGLLNNLGPHAVDQALILMGDVEPDISCQMRCTPLYAGDAESHVKIVLAAPGAPMVDIELTTACAYSQDHWVVMGTQGGLAGTADHLRWKYVVPRALPPLVVSRQPTSDRSYNRETLSWREESVEFPEGNFLHSYTRVYQDLFETLRHGAPLAITPESVRRQIAVLDRCRELSPV